MALTLILSAGSLPGWALPAALGGAAAVFLVLTLILLFTIINDRKGPGGRKTGEEVVSVSVGKLHEQGKRQYQQDSFGISDSSLMSSHGVLAIVADGMGGLADGDKVSSKAVEKILDDFVMYNGKGTHEQALAVLAHQAVSTVNGLLGESNLRKSGSTLVMGLIKNGLFGFVSIGDSRICLYRGGTLIQLNREHIYRNELILRAVNGELPLSEVYSDKNGPGLTSYLGMGELKHIDLPASPIKLLGEDKIILMSDGVYNALSSEEIISALENPPERAAELLKEMIEAKAFGNQDNYTAVIIECRTDPPKSKKPEVKPEPIPKTELPA